MHFEKNWPQLAILKTSKVSFSKKPIYISKKNPKFEPFEISFFSSRTLRQICYNLVRKHFQVETSTNYRCWRERNWQTLGEKRTNLRGVFCFRNVNLQRKRTN